MGRLRRVLWCLPIVALPVTGCTAGPHARAPHAQARARSTASTAATGTSKWQVVSYRGVHARVPATWPVLDSIHATACGSPFPVSPDVLIGPLRGAPSCPALPARLLPRRNGLWLMPGTAPPGAKPVTISPGTIVLGPERADHHESFWYHRVYVIIGIGPAPQAEREIMRSLGFTRGAPDSQVTGACPSGAHPDRMPRPQRLAKPMVLEQGDYHLNPPPPSDRAVMPGARAWQRSGPKSASEIYRVLLVLYSARYPASPSGDGSYTPLDHKILAWVIYSSPLSAHDQACRSWGLDAFDARTSQEIVSASYGPGP